MPSSSVSDGIRSLITELYARGIFLPIEASGGGAVNVYSRVQMQLFQAKQLAEREVVQALADVGMTIDEVRAYLKKHPALSRAFHRAPHEAGCTTADLVYEVGARRRGKLRRLRDRVVTIATKKESQARSEAAHENLLDVARRAAARVAKKTSAVSNTRPDLVTTAPEVDPDNAGRPPVPAGRKTLRVVS
jgi:DNA-binding transcriptional MerR regulator